MTLLTEISTGSYCRFIDKYDRRLSDRQLTTSFLTYAFKGHYSDVRVVQRRNHQSSRSIGSVLQGNSTNPQCLLLDKDAVVQVLEVSGFRAIVKEASNKNIPLFCVHLTSLELISPLEVLALAAVAP